MILTDTAVRGFVVSLVTGILAVTFIPLGIVFAVLGLASDEGAFLPLGVIFFIVGDLFLTVAILWRQRSRRRDRAEADARISRTSARILEAVPSLHSRVRDRHPMKLAVELAGSRQARTVYVPPHVNWQPGQSIEVAYAPDDPRNFVPVAV